MYKFLGMGAVMTASIITGFLMSKELKKRVDILKDIRQSAIYIKTDLEYRAPVIGECFKGRGEFFSKVGKILEEDFTMPKNAFEKACKEFKELNKDDEAALISYAENLCCEEISGQVVNISQLIEEFSIRIENAENEYREKGRLYRSGGVLAGLGLIILLI